MQRTKKRPSDESSESSLDREELRIYLTKISERLAGGVMSVNNKKRNKVQQNTYKPPNGVLLTLKPKEKCGLAFVNRL